MRNSSFPKLILCFLLCGLFSFAMHAQTLPYKSDVLASMQKTNWYFMKKNTTLTSNFTVGGKSRAQNLWTRSVYFEGLMQLYAINKNDSLKNKAITWGTYYKWMPYGGTVTLSNNADALCCGQTYIELYLLDQTQTARITNIKKNIDLMVTSSSVKDWWWIDALQMSMPDFAKLEAIYKTGKYSTKMYALYNYTKTQAHKTGLYNTTDHLWYRDSTFLTAKTTSGKPVYWSRGNGWVIAALARTLSVLPATDSHRAEYVTTFKDMMSKLITLQRKDGFWNSCVNDSAYYGGPETSGTALFAYGLAWGINNGVLDQTTYFPYLTKAWNGMISKAVNTNGSLGFVQSSGSKPSDGQPLSATKMPDFDDFGLGCFLLAGSEVYKLAPVKASSVKAFVEPIIDVATNEVSELKLTGYPNPFTTQINLTYIASNEPLDLFVVSSMGQIVHCFFTQSVQEAGSHTISWNVESMPVGIYSVCLHQGEKTKQLKVIHVR